MTTQGFNKEELVTSLHNTTTALLQLLDAFDEKELHTVPFEGSWTAAQTAEHLIKSNGGAVKTLRGSVAEAKRPINENVDMLKKIFLDYSIKMKSPPWIVPSDAPPAKKEIIGSLSKIMEELQEIAATSDLSLLCMDFEMPNVGPLTRFEWLSFVNVHTIRHTHQVEVIYKKLKSESIAY